MALTWENLKAFGNVVKKTSTPTAVNCVYNALTVWINTVTDKAYLINGEIITPLPATAGSVTLSAQATSLLGLEAEIDAIKSGYMKKSSYDTDADSVVDEAESVDGGSF